MEEIRLILEEPFQPEKKSNILGNIMLVLMIGISSYTAYKYFQTGKLWFLKTPTAPGDENKSASV